MPTLAYLTVSCREKLALPTLFYAMVITLKSSPTNSVIEISSKVWSIYELEVGFSILPVLADIILVTQPTDLTLNETTLSFKGSGYSSFLRLNPQLQIASKAFTSSNKYF